MKKLIMLLFLVALLFPSVIAGCNGDNIASPVISKTFDDLTSSAPSQSPQEYPLYTVKAAYEEIIHELFDKRQLYDTVSATGYSSTEIILSFYSKVETDIVNLVQSMIDNKIPGINLVVNENVPAPSPLVTWIPEITRERAIELASRSLPLSIVNRAVITAELHGWYWEVTFGDLNAKYEELTPWPLKPPPPFPGTTLPPNTNIYQSVYILIDAQTGHTNGAGVIIEPELGPYISMEKARAIARELMSNHPPDVNWGVSPEWFETAATEAYLRGDKWIVIFWNENSGDRYYSVTLNAVTGETISSSAKFKPDDFMSPPLTPPIFP